MTSLAVLLIVSFFATVPLSEAACPKIMRSQAVLRAFQRTHPCPSTGKLRGKCLGWVKDHIWPLCAGGADSPENIVWSPVKEAAAKDRWEKMMCRRLGCLHRGD